jgi:Zn-finger nucleic acid-binding protein
MANAGALRCPSCGAPATPDATACPYCGTLLAQVACPSCFAKLFRGTRFCAHCGAEAIREDAAPRPSRPCPECQQPLAPAKVGSVTLDECTRCGGLWVDSRSFRRICEETEEQTVVLAATDSPREGRVDAPRPARYWPCPECRRLMHRQNFARVSGVIVDTCRGHGVWFNQGELRRVVEFIRDGGMDRARKREKDELEDARARLRQAEIDARLAGARVPGEWRGGSEAHTTDVEVLSAVRGLIDWLS